MSARHTKRGYMPSPWHEGSALVPSMGLVANASLTPGRHRRPLVKDMTTGLVYATSNPAIWMRIADPHVYPDEYVVEPPDDADEYDL